MGGMTAPSPSPPSPPSPTPSGWTPTYCQSCENNKPLVDLGANFGSAGDCINACIHHEGCKFTNYAEGDKHCVLFDACSPPGHIDNCDPKKYEWWTTWGHAGEPVYYL